MKYVIPAAILGLIVIVAISFYVMQSPKTSQQEAISQPSPVASSTGQDTSPQTSKYKDGSYKASGNYVSPGGPREIDLTLVLDDGVITNATFVGKATDATSQRFQGEFASNYKAQVVGKNIDQVKVTKVAGSSLTPIGFTDALNKIKAEAAS